MNTSRSPVAENHLPVSTDSSRAATNTAPAEISVGPEGVTGMLATESSTNPASRLLKELNACYIAQADPTRTMSEEYGSMVSPKERQCSTTTSQPPSRSHSRPLPNQEEAHGSLQTTPDSKSAYSSPDDYHGGSDISVRRSASSATDRELFSGSEEDSESEDDEPSGFEPTEVADLLPAASGALGTGEKPCEFTSDGMAQDMHYSEFDDVGSDDKQYEPAEYGQPNRTRNFSYESYPIEMTSPTESQLAEEGFEFHNQLPEERLIGHFNHEERLVGQFNHEAFQDAIKEVTADLPRKQQWYTWRKVMEMLEKDDATHEVAAHRDAESDDLFDDSDLPNDFSLGSLADHSFGGCQCGGDSSKCTCAPGQCGCASCPRREQEQPEQVPMEHEDQEQQDVPMIIGYTPITPSFPPILHYPQPSRARSVQPSSNTGIRIPGLEPFAEDEPAQMHHISECPSGPRSAVPNPECSCQCGRSCQCPPGNCKCDKADDSGDISTLADNTSREPFNDCLRPTASVPDSRDIWSDAATAGLSSPATDPREPEARGNTFPQIARALTRSTVLSRVDAPTPVSGFRSPLPSPKRGFVSVPTAISRPDTPRPVGDTYDHGIRQSVEPEHVPPTAHRESTPAYENRSLSPSPVSHGTPSDVEMHDITPPCHEPMLEREALTLPDAPGQEPLSPPGSPNMDVAPDRALPGPYGIGNSTDHAYSVPPPPIPVSPTLKPRKQRATSGTASPGKRNTKSGVQGSKIAKPQPKPKSVARNVTAKAGKGKRNATGARVKQAVDAIEDSVKRDAEDRQRGLGGEHMVLQRDGTPPRRSGRVRARSQSPCV